MKRLYCLHDAAGVRYPELDWRWVTGAVMAEYLDGISRDTLIKRATAKAYGWGREQGVRHIQKHDRDRGRMEYRPALIWQRQRMGRYGDPQFDWRQLDGKVAIYATPPGESPRTVTATAIPPLAGDAPLQVQATLADLARAAATALALLSRSNAPAIAFPGSVSPA